jgi:hypothetical protein
MSLEYWSAAVLDVANGPNGTVGLYTKLSADIYMSAMYVHEHILKRCIISESIRGGVEARLLF